MAKLRHRDAALMNAIAGATVRLRDRLSPQNVSMTLWAFASLDVKHAGLMGALCGAALRQVATFNPQELCNTAWAIASLRWTRHGADALFRALLAARSRDADDDDGRRCFQLDKGAEGCRRAAERRR